MNETQTEIETMATKTAMSMQEIKDKIDGYHCLQVDGHLSAGDCGDAIGDLTRGLSPKDYDEAHDYVWESYCKHGLNK